MGAGARPTCARSTPRPRPPARSPRRSMRDALTRSLGLEWGPVRNGIAELVGVPDAGARALLPAPRRDRRGGARAGLLEPSRDRRHPARDARPKAGRLARARRRRVARPRGRARLRRTGARRARRSSARDGRGATAGRARRRRARMLGPAGLTQRSAHFTRREVIQALADGSSRRGRRSGVLEALADDFIATALRAARRRLASSRTRPPGGALLDARHAPLRGAPARDGSGR